MKKLSKVQFDDLWRRWRDTGDDVLRNRLMESYLPLVGRIANMLHGTLVQQVDVGDLEADGLFGLLDALQSYDPDRNCAFTTMASLRIRGAMIDGLRERDFVPRLARERAKLVNRAKAAFEHEHGREPTRDELHVRLKVSTEKFNRLMNDQPRELMALDSVAYYHSEKPVTYADELESRREPDPDAKLDAEAIIDFALKQCGVRAALLLRMRYLDQCSPTECAMALGYKNDASMYFRLRTLLPHLRGAFSRGVAA